MRHFLLGLLALSFAVAAAAAASGSAARTLQGTEGANRGKHPDLAGVWFMEGKVQPNLIPPETAPLTPWGVAQFKVNQHQVNRDAICLPPGVPKVWLLPAPFEIIPARGRLIIFYENQHIVRQIHLNRSEHPKDSIPLWMGDSIGKWDGDTLVIDTTGFNDLTWTDLWGLPHSDKLHVVERIRRVSHAVLQVDILVDDPKAYTKSWTAQRRFDLKPGWEVGEEICEENNTYLVPAQNPNPDN